MHALRNERSERRCVTSLSHLRLTGVELKHHLRNGYFIVARPPIDIPYEPDT